MYCYTDKKDNATAIVALNSTRLSDWLPRQPASVQRWVENSRFKAQSGEVLLLALDSGELDKVLLGVNDSNDFWAFGALPKKLPAGVFYIDNRDNFFNHAQYQRAQMGWGLGSYQFNHYVKRDHYPNQLALDGDADKISHITSSNLI